MTVRGSGKRWLIWVGLAQTYCQGTEQAKDQTGDQRVVHGVSILCGKSFMRSLDAVGRTLRNLPVCSALTRSHQCEVPASGT